MTTIELTEDQWQALQAEQGKPIDVVDPATHRRYVLIACEQYERVRALLEQDTGQGSLPAAEGISPGIFLSQQAFWRDLPELLQNQRNRGKWVCYHGNERIGIADTERSLIRECLQRGYRDDEYYTEMIVPHEQPPWEPEEIEAGGHEVEECASSDPSGNAEGIPTGIFRSQQAFWRDLPELLRDRKNHGRWAAYHGDKRIGTAPTKAELVQEILRQGVARDEYYVGRIRPQALAPWEPVEVEPTYSHDVEDLLTES